MNDEDVIKALKAALPGEFSFEYHRDFNENTVYLCWKMQEFLVSVRIMEEINADSICELIEYLKTIRTTKLAK